MSFMNAKEARPVDDPKALVPFGWAPGGYYCTACSTCGEAHSGSDKRSARCQDCAEALRDKQAVEPAPTTRAADHAELAACPFCGAAAKLSRIISPDGERRGDTPSWDIECNGCWLHGRWSSEVDARAAWNRRDPQATLLSEIAALRGDLTVSRDDLDQLQAHFRQRDREATQAERQRDEARDTIASTVAKADWMQGHLSGERSSIDRETIELVVSECRAYCHLQALANQGADQ